ncbi:MAG: FkbM family methyltransferase [Pseudanabaenaceae cyanobacterium bins.68]|nr:FkbM family methyltransferase [Pseudanabaenaceae cyanobacterium bins.68]
MNMNFSGISNQSLLGKLLRKPLELLPPNLEVPILQGRLKSKKWIVGASNHGCWLGSYEYEKQLLFQQTIKSGDVVFDIGANVGFYSLLASVIVGNQGQVFAFEPLPRNLTYLRTHLALNHCENVRVFPVAVADFSGKIQFDQSENHCIGHISTTGELEVDATSLDDLYAQAQISLPNHLKIDVEGAELAVLKGASQVINRAFPTIFLATHGAEVHQACCALLKSWGYELKSLTAADLDQTDELIAAKPN